MYGTLNSNEDLWLASRSP